MLCLGGELLAVRPETGDHVEFNWQPTFERLFETFEIAPGVKLPPGDYKVTVTNPVGMTPTLANVGLAGPAQTRLTAADIRTDPGISPGGRYSHVYPLRDGTGERPSRVTKQFSIEQCLRDRTYIDRDKAAAMPWARPDRTACPSLSNA